MANEIPNASEQPSKQIPGPNRRRRLLVVCAIVVAMIMIAASTALLHYDRQGVFSHHYYVKVEANGTEEYTIRLPVPHDTSSRYPLSFLGDIEVLDGDPAFQLGVYGHGMGLEVSARGDLEFEWTEAWPESSNVRYGNLTMTTGAEGWSSSSRLNPCCSWIYSDRSDIRIQFLYTSIHEYMVSPMLASGGGPTFSFIEYPEGTGWQEMPVDYGWVVLN